MDVLAGILKLAFVVGTLVLSGWLGFKTVAAMERGARFTAALRMFLTAIIPMSISWLVVQRAQPELFDTAKLMHGSAAAIIADPFVIPLAVMLGAIGWRAWRQHDEYLIADLPSTTAAQYTRVLLCVGFPVGAFMHWGLGGPADSQSADLGVQLHDSATSWAHNIGVVPAVVAVFACYLRYMHVWSKWFWLSLAVLLIGLGGLIVFDAWRAGLDPANPLHFNPHWLDTVLDWAHLRPA